MAIYIELFRFSAFPEVPVSLYAQFSRVTFAAAHFNPVLVFLNAPTLPAISTACQLSQKACIF